MKWQGRGVILHMSASSGIVAATDPAVYGASRSAIAGLTRTLDHELDPHGIRVSCMLPGAVETARQRRKWSSRNRYRDEYGNGALEPRAGALELRATDRLLQPDEVARLALFLAADPSGGIASGSEAVDDGWV